MSARDRAKPQAWDILNVAMMEATWETIHNLNSKQNVWQNLHLQHGNNVDQPDRYGSVFICDGMATDCEATATQWKLVESYKTM